MTNPIVSNFETVRQELILRLRQHPFLTKCRNGQISSATMETFLVQQGLYSQYFTRYLCAFMSNLPDNESVVALAENLFDEMGFRDDSQTPHSVIYKNMLESMGLSMSGQVALAGTTKLIQTMFEHCRSADVAKGLGALCLGAEALVPDLYGDIVVGMETLGHGGEQTAFFRIHMACDDAHAETLQNMVKALVKRDPDSFARVQQSGRELVEARLFFFDSIESAVRY